MVDRQRIVAALADLESEIEDLEHLAHQAQGMLATLAVNFGHNGRVASGIARAGDRGDKQLYDVLKYLVDRCGIGAVPVRDKQPEEV